jgi:DNA repair protein RadB
MGVLSLGCGSLDKLLGGGIEAGIITNIYGAPGSGKTNFALQASVSCIRQGKKVIFIDTESGLSPERFLQMAGSEEHLKNMMILKPRDFQGQSDIIKGLEAIIAKEKAGLVVVDSIVGLYRIAAHGDTKYAANQELTCQFIALSQLAEKCKIPVLVTNQVYAVFDSDEVELVGKDLPKYYSKVLIFIEKKGTGRRRATIIKHRHRPEDSFVEFEIKDEGLVDAEKKFGLF